MARKILYICGDSFSSTDPDWAGYHWSERLSKKMPEYQIKNLSYPGATNLSIAAQIEKALADLDTAFIIINASDVFRIDLPNKFLKRKDKHVVSKNMQYSYNDFKKIGEKIYTEVYKNAFVQPDAMYDLFNHIYSKNSGYDESKVLASFGMWSLTMPEFDPQCYFTEEVYDATINYFQNLFDLNIRFHNDLNLIEGKLYKTYVKKIPFLYNLGGLVNQRSFLYRVFPDVIKNVCSQHNELQNFYSEINLFDVVEDSYMTDKKSPAFHIASDTHHQNICEYYLKRINEINAS